MVMWVLSHKDNRVNGFYAQKHGCLFWKKLWPEQTLEKYTSCIYSLFVDTTRHSPSLHEACVTQIKESKERKRLHHPKKRTQ